MGEISMRNWDLREFHMQVNLSSQRQQVQFQIWWAISPIGGLLYPIRQVKLLISHFWLCPPYSSHLHTPSVSFLSTTRTSSLDTKLSHHSLSFHAIIMSWCQVQHYTECIILRVQHTPSTAYTESNTCRVQHTPSTAYTKDCLLSLHSQNYELTPECGFSVWHALLQINLH